MKRKAISLDEWKFTNQNWKKVLKEIVDYAPNRYGRSKRDYTKDHPLVKRLKITAYELTMIMAFLEEQGLIEYAKPEYNWIHITSKGFDVALQNQRAVNTERMSRASLFLSLVIALVAFANLLIGIPNPIEKWGVSIILSIAIIVAGLSIKKM